MIASDSQRRELIEKIRRLPSELEEVVCHLTPEQLHTPFLAGEWTVAQNVHHLVDSHINSFVRLKLILTEDQPPLKGYEQDKWAEMADERNTPIEPSLMILRGLHHRWVILFESLLMRDWQRFGLHSESGPMTVDALLSYYAAHGEGHIDQINRTLAAATE